MDKYQEYEERFNNTIYAVEATDFEAHRLWNQWSKEFEWDEGSDGLLITVGKLNDSPVCFSASWVEINRVLVLMYHATSNVVDHSMIEKWITENTPNLKGRTDAQNFHNIINRVKGYL